MKVEKTYTAALRIAHIALGCLWVAGLIGMLVFMVFPLNAPIEEKLIFFHAIDEWLVIPCAVAAVITGLVLVRIKSEYSLRKSAWIFKKLIICCSVMLGGYFFVKTPLLLDFLNSILAPFSISIEAHSLFLALTVLATVLLLLVFHLSITKPTKKTSLDAGTS